MANDILYQQKFKCKCKVIKTHLTWLSEIDTHVCVVCKKPMKPIFDKPKDTAPATIIASKHAKGRLPKENYLRRTDDFIKNILPRMGGEDKKHFNKKFGMVK